MKRRNGNDAMTTHSTRITIENDPRWAAVVARDPRADGQFVYAVKTTGVYCRPSSLARLPNPQNVEFFDTAELAQAAGYRPSKRAAKDQSEIAAQHAATVAAACRQIEEAEELPALSDLALAAGLSSFHFHRVFKTVTGLTPGSTPAHIDLAKCASIWAMAARSLMRCTTPASIPIAGFTQRRTMCWA